MSNSTRMKKMVDLLKILIPSFCATIAFANNAKDNSLDWVQTQDWQDSPHARVATFETGLSNFQCPDDQSLEFPNLMHARQDIYVDDRLVATNGSNLYIRSIYGAPIIPCSTIQGSRMKWHIEAFVKSFAKVKSWPTVSTRDSINRSEALHLATFGATLIVAIFLLASCWHTLFFRQAVRIAGFSVAMGSFLAISVLGLLGIKNDYLLVDKIAGLALSVAISSFVAFLHERRLIRKWPQHLTNVICVVSAFLVLISKDGDQIQTVLNFMFLPGVASTWFGLYAIFSKRKKEEATSSLLSLLALGSFAATTSLDVAYTYGLHTEGMSLAYGILGVTFFFGLVIQTDIKKMHQEREHLRQNLAQEVASKTSSLNKALESVKAMHDSIDEAFMVFDPNGLSKEVISNRSQEILNLSQKVDVSIFDVFSKSESERKKLTSWYQLLFDDRCDFEEMSERGPKTLELENRVLRLRYYPMYSPEGRVKNVILTALDISAEAAANKNARDANERATMILRIHENRSGFRPFLEMCESTTGELRDWADGDYESIRRSLHTIKGTALLYGISSLAERVNAAEMKLKMEGDKPKAELIRLVGKALHEQLQSWRARELNLFTQLGVFSDETFEVSRGKIERLLASLKCDQLTRDLIERTMFDLTSTEFGELILDYRSHVESTAKKIGKSVSLTVEPMNGPVNLFSKSYSEVIRSFVHLFNNAIDHGIESPEKRVAVGKPSTGNITVRYEVVSRPNGNYLKTVIADDGAGIDIPKLRETLKKRGFGTDDEQDHLRTAMHIFDHGLSTSAEISQLSGQGVGMGAVRATILAARGKIQIIKTDTSGTWFEILLPEPKGGFFHTPTSPHHRERVA